MRILNHLFQLELFAAPVWKMAQNTLKKQDAQTFKKRWPTWSKRLEYFPSLRAELLSQIFKDDKNQFNQFQKDVLESFFKHSTVASNDSLVSSTLSGLCLAHNWEALKTISKYISFNSETHTVIACAMAHEANDPFWDRILTRSRIEIGDVVRYIQENKILPYHRLNEFWNDTLFYSQSTFSNLNTYNFYVDKPLNSADSVLPNFEQESLWAYAMISMRNDIVAQKIVEYSSLPAERLIPFFVRKHPLHEDFVYTVIKQNLPLCATLASILTTPMSVDYSNIVGILKHAAPEVAPSFESALQRIANEEQRQRLIDTVDALEMPSTRRKM